MDDEQRDACLIEIRIKIASMTSDLIWIKRIIAGGVIVIAAIFGVDAQDIFIQG